MLEKYKEDFSAWLKKIEKTNIDPQASCNNELDELTQNINKSYQKIRHGLSTRLEDLKIISDILKSRYSHNNVDNYGDDSLKLVTDKITDKISCYVYFEMQESLVSFNLEKGKLLFDQGRIDEALDAWEKILEVNPDNEYVHSKLLEIRDISQSTKIRAEELHQKYKFKYIGSFGHNVMKKPFAIVASGNDDIIFVSDFEGNKIHKFSVKGKYLGALSVEVENPMELFKDAEGNIWICDFGNCRLLAVALDGNVVDEISLKDILGETYGLIHPGFGCLKENMFYLIVMDGTRQQRRLLSFKKNNPHDSLEILPTDLFQVLNVFEFLDNQLYVCDLAQSDLFVYNSGQKYFNRIGYQGIPYPLRWFVGSSDGLFFSAGNRLLKVSLKGQKLFTANLENIFAMHDATPLGLAVLREKHTQVLFVTDNSPGCIHKFSI